MNESQESINAVLDELEDAERAVRKRWRLFWVSIYFDVILVTTAFGASAFIRSFGLDALWIFLVQFVLLGALLGIPSYRWKRALVRAKQKRLRLQAEADRLLAVPSP